MPIRFRFPQRVRQRRLSQRCSPLVRPLSHASASLSPALAFLGTTAVVLAALQGCATLSEADCLSADWAVMGESDGQRGRPLSELNRYRRQCAEYGVVPDTQAYMQARARGLAVYCTHSNGYREGRSGARGEPVCPAALEPDFRSGFQLGQAVYASVSALRSSSESIASTRDRIEELRSEIADHEASIRSGGLDEAQERQAREQIDSLSRRIDDLEDDLVILVGSVTVAIAQYTGAVQAARAQGHDEPMEAELIRELQRLAR